MEGKVKSQLTHPKYRADIDGLRAIAILSVIGYHAFPGWVRGGFAGVDIFFVISGFLISTIIFNNLERNSFSFVEFYSRRVKRIFPALITVLTASFTIGWFILLADEYKQLGKHIAAGAGFISNLLLWTESGYFDNTADTKPLLHLWSLGIEEQFYIVWPLLLWSAWKLKLKFLTTVIFIAAISFALNIFTVKSDATAAFYSPQTRFWELLAGSTLAYLTLFNQNVFKRLKPWYVNLQSSLGAILIAVGFLLITKESAFPGWWALLPTAGAALVISAGNQAWLNRAVLSNRILVWFGLISFPLYLWHWPLLSFARIMEGSVPDREIRIAAIAASIVLAWLTYWLIEKPIRFGKDTQAKIVALVLIMALVGYVGYNCFKRDGLEFRAFPKRLEKYSKTITRTDKVSECFDIPYAYEKTKDWHCKLGNQSVNPMFFAYGDSHALSLLPALEKFANEKRTSILFTGTSGCPPLLGIQSIRGEDDIKKHNCRKLNERIFNYVKDNRIESVILIARWTYYTGGTVRPEKLNYISMDTTKESTEDFSKFSFSFGLKNTIQKYDGIGVKVFLVEDTPRQIFDPKDALRKTRPTDHLINKLSVSFDEHKSDQSFIADEVKKYLNRLSAVINFDDILCTKEQCQLAQNGKFLYFDDDHLSVAGALLIYPALYEKLSTPKPRQ